MSNQFPDPSQSPWTNPDTGVEFEYNTETGSWAPAKESTPGTGETLDSVSQRDSKTDINVTVGNTIGMDDSKDAFKGGPHELEARVGKFGEITNENPVLEIPVGSEARAYAYSPTLDLHVFVKGYDSNTGKYTRAWKGKIGNIEEYSVPLQNGEDLNADVLIWAGDRFVGIPSYGSHVWESLDGENWTLHQSVTNHYEAGNGDSASGRTVYHEETGKLMTITYDRNTSYEYRLFTSNPGDYSNEDEIDFGHWNNSTTSVLKNPPEIVIPTYGGRDDSILAKYSSDGGATWTTVLKEQPDGLQLKDLISYVNGKYWASVTCGTYAVSSDLVSWEVKSHPTYNYSEWMGAWKPDPTKVIESIPQLYHEGVYVLAADHNSGPCRSGWNDNHFILYSRDSENWAGAMGVGFPTTSHQEYFDMDYDNMFVDSDDNLILPMVWNGKVYYMPNFIEDVVRIDRTGLYYDDELVATRDNLDPVIDIINNHTEQIGNLDGKYMPLDINTLPPA